ncbi:hypothetical protein GEMRC1_009886 [Eukaryota sp. GEM-RC1]
MSSPIGSPSRAIMDNDPSLPITRVADDVPIALSTSVPLLEGSDTPAFRHAFDVKAEYHTYSMSRKKIELPGLKIFFNDAKDCQPVAIKDLFLSHFDTACSNQNILLHPNSIKSFFLD